MASDETELRTYMVSVGPSGSWQSLLATSIEDARRRGCEALPGARPYGRQAVLL